MIVIVIVVVIVIVAHGQVSRFRGLIVLDWD
jgi:hypothetical protein